jgi:hypothetical protein
MTTGRETGMTTLPADAPATALSPYLSLRQAVRPAIVTYTVLAGEQERAGALAAEAGQLLDATRQLLEAVGLVHLLSPKQGEEMPGDDHGDRQARLLAAYADAGVLWAKVVGNSIALADGLLGQARWDDVLRLADFLDHAGETAVAGSLRERANDAIRSSYYARMNRINDKMSADETAAAIETLRSLPRDFPDRKLEIALRLRPVGTSVKNVTRPDRQARNQIDQAMTTLPDSADYYLAVLSDIFHSLVK